MFREAKAQMVSSEKYVHRSQGPLTSYFYPVAGPSWRQGQKASVAAHACRWPFSMPVTTSDCHSQSEIGMYAYVFQKILWLDNFIYITTCIVEKNVKSILALSLSSDSDCVWPVTSCIPPSCPFFFETEVSFINILVLMTCTFVHLKNLLNKKNRRYSMYIFLCFYVWMNSLVSFSQEVPSSHHYTSHYTHSIWTHFYKSCCSLLIVVLTQQQC